MRNQYLDLLRAIAILMVLGMHFKHFALLNRIGGNGVDLFFVLSGYLISGLLFREYRQTGTIEIGRFLLRRGLKIWPALYIYLAVMVIPMAYGNQLTALPAAALFYVNYTAKTAGVVGHTWSLAVEEHFYIVLPFVLAWMMRRKWLGYMPWLYAVTAFGCGVARYFEPHVTDRYTHSRIDTLLLGVLFCYWHEFQPRVFAALGRLPLVGFALLVGAWTLPIGSAIGDFVLAWGLALLLAWGVDRKMTIPLLPTIGVYSYSIYLWQQPFAVYAEDRHIGLFVFAALMAGAITLGVIMATLVEMPVLRLRDRWTPKTKEAGAWLDSSASRYAVWFGCYSFSAANRSHSPRENASMN